MLQLNLAFVPKILAWCSPMELSLFYIPPFSSVAYSVFRLGSVDLFGQDTRF